MGRKSIGNRPMTNKEECQRRRKKLVEDPEKHQKVKDAEKARLREHRTKKAATVGKSNEIKKLENEIQNLREQMKKDREKYKNKYLQEKKEHEALKEDHEALGGRYDATMEDLHRANETLTNYIRKEGECTRDGCVHAKLELKQAQKDIEWMNRHSATRDWRIKKM